MKMWAALQQAPGVLQGWGPGQRLAAAWGGGGSAQHEKMKCEM